MIEISKVSASESVTDIVIYHAPIDDQAVTNYYNLPSGDVDGLTPPNSIGTVTAFDIVLDNDADGISAYPSVEWKKTVAHEFGHVLGLEDTFSDPAFDQRFTIMSANAISNAGETWYAVTPMAYDVEAVRLNYSGTDTVSASNTTYSIANNDFSGVRQMQTIVDDGGYDVFDLSSETTGVVIDLRQALEVTGGTYIPHDYKTIVGDEWIYLAKWTVIEAAAGGSGNDSIVGNDATNTFIFAGSFGTDTVTGGEVLEIGGNAFFGTATETGTANHYQFDNGWQLEKLDADSLRLTVSGGTDSGVIRIDDWSESHDYGITLAAAPDSPTGAGAEPYVLRIAANDNTPMPRWMRVA